MSQKSIVPKTIDYSLTDAKALHIPDSSTGSSESMAAYMKAHFPSDMEKARGIFIWIASNIQYDVANMFALNFYEKAEDKITKPLKTRKGICENYAALFTDICQKTGIQSYVIEGYTKQQGFADYIPHAWCAALIDSSWFLFDPTWGSGYINNGKFVKKINNEYFKALPGHFIKSHMPFDYLWEFENYPVTNQEFYEGRTQPDKSKPFFNYTDSIRIYEGLPSIDQLSAASARVENNGIKNSLIFDRLQHLKREIEIYKQNEAINLQNANIHLYNSALTDYNKAINNFNVFINYLNNQFQPIKPDPTIQNMIDTVAVNLADAKSKLIAIKNPDANNASLIVTFNKSIDELAGRVTEQQDWLKTYFSKGKGGRKSMFRKYTWFGIPLN